MNLIPESGNISNYITLYSLFNLDNYVRFTRVENNVDIHF